MPIRQIAPLLLFEQADGPSQGQLARAGFPGFVPWFHARGVAKSTTAWDHLW
jgi:hypothetical protein